MAKALRWLGYGIAAVLVVALLAAAWIWFASSRTLSATVEPVPETLVRPTPAQLADAPRQLRVLGCIGCHGDKLEGELFIRDPKVARFYASNLTRVAAKASDQQLAQAIRQGIGHDGRQLLVMPAEEYQFLSDQEVAALIAAIRRFPKAGREHPAIQPGPIGRLGLALGRLRPVPALVEDYRASPIPDFGPRFAHGRHIVATNCSGCHGADLKGRELEPGVITADLALAGAYDLEQFRTMLKTGVAPGGKDIGMMGRVAKSDFSHLRVDEIAAVHAYLVEWATRAP